MVSHLFGTIPKHFANNFICFFFISLCLCAHARLQVNIVCTKIKGEPLYEVVKPIAAHQELVVYYMLEQHERPEDFLFVHMRSSIYRKTLNSILEGE